MENDKGSRREEDLVPFREAARMLNLVPTTLHKMASRGIIQPVYRNSGREKYFSQHDISALAEIIERKIDMASVADIAMQAYVTAKSNDRRLDDLYHLLGFRRPKLGTTESEVIALFIRTQDTVNDMEPEDAELVHEWAGIFYSVDEAYLNLVHLHTGIEEPWVVFLNLANAFVNQMPAHSFSVNPPLKSAYAYLAMSRDVLRSASYYYCRVRVGAKRANEAFRHVDDPIEDVIRLLFPPLSQVRRAG